MILSIEPIKPLIGASVHVDKSDLLNAEVIEHIHQALEERQVLVFPKIDLSDAEQLAFTEALGGQVIFESKVPGTDAESNVYKVTLDRTINTEPDYVLGTFFWHIDGVTTPQPIPKGTLLSARQLSDHGGLTEFANLYAAYDRLSDAEKAEAADLQVIHTLEASVRPVYGNAPDERIQRWRSIGDPVVHPLVWTHPDGRKSLLLGSHADAIVGWPQPHGRAYLWRLQQWAAQPDLTYLHSWNVGDLVIWNNQGLMHRVVPYTDEGRRMHRTSLAGGAVHTGVPIERSAFDRLISVG
jgi:alpha-ketoglutarate-dependent taurine dioxygenase